MTNEQTLPVTEKSSLTQQDIEKLLESSHIPIRLACNSKNGFPLLASLWYYYETGVIYCATHRRSKIAKNLERDTKVGFEVAADSQPYCGVRGQAIVSLSEQNAKKTLERLLKRYRIKEDAPLAKWLLSRSEEEYVIAITPKWITGWDYSERMGRS